MNSQSQIVEKVRKLLALSRSSNVNEAAVAASIANKYIVQYRLKEADLIEQRSQASNTNQFYPDPMFDDPEPVYVSARVTSWKLYLLCLLAHHYGCAVWNDKHFSASNGKRSISRFRLIGRCNDVHFTKYMFTWLMNEIQRHSEVECKGYGHTTSSSYCKGAVRGVEELLRNTRSEQHKLALQLGKSRAISRIDSREQEAKEYMYRTYHLVQAPPPKPKFDPIAFERGFDVGNYIGKHIAPNKD